LLPSPYNISLNFWDWSQSATQTLDPKGAVVAGADDAWEATVLILEGMDHSAMHSDTMVEDKPFGR